MNEKIQIQDEDGTVRDATILFNFEYEGKTYVLYTFDDDEEGEVMAQIYQYEETPEGVFEDLVDIETPEEWEIVEEMFNSFVQEEVLAFENE